MNRGWAGQLWPVRWSPLTSELVKVDHVRYPIPLFCSCSWDVIERRGRSSDAEAVANLPDGSTRGGRLLWSCLTPLMLFFPGEHEKSVKKARGGS